MTTGLPELSWISGVHPVHHYQLLEIEWSNQCLKFSKGPRKSQLYPRSWNQSRVFPPAQKVTIFQPFQSRYWFKRSWSFFSFLSDCKIRSEVSSAKAETHHRKVKYQPCLGVVPCNPQLMLISWRCWGSPGSKNSKKLQYLLSSRKTVLKLLNVCFAANPFQFSKEDTMASIVIFCNFRTLGFVEVQMFLAQIRTPCGNWRLEHNNGGGCFRWCSFSNGWFFGEPAVKFSGL